jgi:hypothetical protein
MTDVKKSVKISFVILLIMMILALIYGLMALLTPQIIVARSFQGFVGMSWIEFASSNQIVAGYILILERMAGGLGLAAVIGGLIVLLAAFRKAEKWAWFYILIISLIAWVNNLVANIICKNVMTTWIIIIGLVLLAVGLLIPAKDFFSRE